MQKIYSLLIRSRSQRIFIHRNIFKLSGMLVLIIFLSVGIQSCANKDDKNTDIKGEKKQEVFIKKRADGTISSISQVDEYNKVHGQRLEYYADGKTLYSNVTYKRGVRNGPAIWYYKNGNASLQLNYLNGKKEGPSKSYYQSGRLKAETRYADDHPLPGLKEYDMEGNLITEYSDVSIRENYRRGNGSTVVIELSCSRKSDKVKFYYLEEENGVTSRIYLISENGSAVKRFYLREGQVINKDINFLVEIPTDLGNTLVKELSYHLDARSL